MKADSGQIELLFARVDRLEKQNRLLKRLAAVTFGVATILVALGMSQSPTHSVIEASEIRLVDASGRVRAELLMERDNPLFSLRDANGHRTALLMSDAESSSLGLLHDTALTYLKGGPKAALLIEGPTGRVTLRADSEGPSVRVEDHDGDTSATLGRSRINSSKKSAKDKPSTASLVLMDGDKVLWSAP